MTALKSLALDRILCVFKWDYFCLRNSVPRPKALSWLFPALTSLMLSILDPEKTKIPGIPKMAWFTKLNLDKVSWFIMGLLPAKHLGFLGL